MEIIKRGIAPKEKEYFGRCTHCGTEVKFKHSEITVSYDPVVDNYVGVNCPVCGKIIYGRK